MSGDETFLFFLAIAGTLFSFEWFKDFFAIGDQLRKSSFRFFLPVASVAGLLIIWFVLRHWADDAVRRHSGYLFLLMGLGFLLQTISLGVISPWFGLSPHEDIIVHRNKGASAALAGLTIGVSLCYAGANIGEGPFLWNNLFSAALSVAALLLAWVIVQTLGKIGDSITGERDFAAGIRFAAFAIAVGLVLGRSVAGNWVSPSGTVKDLVHIGWPVLLLSLFAGILERYVRPTRQRPFPDWKLYGLPPSFAYVASATLYITVLGRWNTK